MVRLNVTFLLALVALFSLNLLHLSRADSCSTSEKDAIALCAVAAMKDWNVTSVDLVSKKFALIHFYICLHL